MKKNWKKLLKFQKKKKKSYKEENFSPIYKKN